MTDFASDLIVLFDLIKELSIKLREKNPEHELLRFVGPVLEKEIWPEGMLEVYLKRFAPEKSTTTLQAMLNYHNILEEAVRFRGKCVPEG